MNNIVTCLDNRNGLVMQLHITGRCNLHCKHCYRTEYSNEPIRLDDISMIIEQFKGLVKEYNKKKGIDFKGEVHITGGEPLLREDFFEILKVFYKNRKMISYTIMTNGSLIDDWSASKIKEYQVKCVQVSIDGKPETHDSIRGKGNYKKTFESIDILRRYGIPVIVSFTANKMNYMEFAHVSKCCEEHDVDLLWTDRVVPIGNGYTLEGGTLTVEECMEYFEIIKKEYDRVVASKSRMEISIDRALQFIVSKHIPHRCAAGDSLFAIDEQGNFLPCRRMPIVCGNVFNESMEKIYFENAILNDLRRRNIPNECQKCRFKSSCNGGAKCIAYAISGKYDEAEPFCPLIHYGKNENENGESNNV